MKWKVHGERQVYDSEWVQLCLSDVQPRGHRRFEHHLIKLAPSIGTLIVDQTDRVLMLWRHRFTTDTWNWELPGGWVEPGESPKEAAAREAEEETGWRPSHLCELAYIQPIAGIANAEQYIFLSDEATCQGGPADLNESDRVAWIPLADIPEMIQQRRIVGGVSVVALLRLLVDRAQPATDLRTTDV